MDKDFDADAALITKKPDIGRFGKTARRMAQGAEGHISSRAVLNWRQDSEALCNKALQTSFSAPELDGLKETVRQSRMGEALLARAETAGVRFCYDRQIVFSQLYPSAEGGPVISLHPDRPRGELVNLMIRELRRFWQHAEGALVNPLNYEPDEAILVNRALQADVLMVTIRTAWELRLAGHEESWGALTGSPVSDMSRTFEVRAQADFRTLNNGEAARAVYDKFFEDSRTRAHDKRIIHQMLLDETGYIKSSEKRPKVTQDLFFRLGQMPFGKNYLSIRAKHHPMDACYATVEDRSNANFLWFVKFERSFQEKEKQLITESVKLSAEIVDFAKWALKAGRQKEI
jgi:hypothetical protein